MLKERCYQIDLKSEQNGRKRGWGQYFYTGQFIQKIFCNRSKNSVEFCALQWMCFQSPFPQIFNPFLNSMISANHEQGLGSWLIVKSLCSIIFLQCRISFIHTIPYENQWDKKRQPLNSFFLLLQQKIYFYLIVRKENKMS